jgi:apolipoprotein N-acyltransferase
MEGTLSESPNAHGGSGARSIALAALLFSGVVQAFISPPLNWVALHPLAWVPAFWVFSRLRGPRALLAGWLVGASANAAIFYWLVHTLQEFSSLTTAWGVAALILFSLGVGFYCGVFAWGFGAIRRVSGGFWPFGIAAWFAICEFVNPQLFPYFQGVAWYQIPSIFLVVSVTGVAGVSFLVMAANGIALQAIEWRRGAARGSAVARNAVLLMVGIAAAMGVSAQRLERIADAESRSEPLRVALIQANYGVQVHRKLVRETPEKIAEEHVAMSREALTADPEIRVVVWPEKVLHRSPRKRHNKTVIEFAQETGVEVWTGGDRRTRRDDGPRKTYNSAFRVSASGDQDQRYDKIILVPFGEFVPFVDVFPALGRIQGVGYLTPGEELYVYDAPQLARFAFLICYEAIRSEFIRDAIVRDVDLLVNLTFDGWYGDTSEPTEHLMLAAIQSALYGVPMLRSTSTGISALIDARGMITQRSSLFTREVVVGDVKPVRVRSVYTDWGEWFVWSCGAVSVALLALSRRRGPGATIAR